MRRALVWCLSKGTRRAMTAFLSAGLIAICSWGTVKYLDEWCAQPSIALLTLLLWVVVLTGLWWLCLLAISPVVILPKILVEWMRENALENAWELSADEQDQKLRSIGFSVPLIAPDDPRQFRVNAESRFRTYFFFGILGVMLCTHFLSDHFLTRFQSSGLPMIYLRSPDSLLRLKGLNILVDSERRKLLVQDDQGELSAPLPLERALLSALRDSDEGVVARAALVCGQLHIAQAVPQLAQLAREHEALSEVALLALGTMPVTLPVIHPANEALRSLAADPKVLQMSPLALAIAIGRQRVNLYDILSALYKQNRDQHVHPDALKVRQAAIWALGEVSGSDGLPSLTDALADDALSVRCLAAQSFEKVVAFESSIPLRAAFERSQATERCSQIVAPTQEGVRPLVLMEEKSYQLALMRALATTDDPELLEWMVAHQEGIDPMANRLMYKYYKALEEKDKAGLLETFKRRNAERLRSKP